MALSSVFGLTTQGGVSPSVEGLEATEEEGGVGRGVSDPCDGETVFSDGAFLWSGLAFTSAKSWISSGRSLSGRAVTKRFVLREATAAETFMSAERREMTHLLLHYDPDADFTRWVLGFHAVLCCALHSRVRPPPRPRLSLLLSLPFTLLLSSARFRSFLERCTAVTPLAPSLELTSLQSLPF